MREFESTLRTLIAENTLETQDKAARIFYHHFEKKIIAYGLKRKLTKSDATDLVADTFWAILTAPPILELDNYVWGVVRNLVRRKFKKTEQYMDWEENDFPEPALEPLYSLHEDLSGNDSLEWLEQNLEQLEGKLKHETWQLLQERFWKNKKLKDIAAERNEKAGTTRKKLSDTLSKLRNWMPKTFLF